MIAKVSRGTRVAGLVAYLMGEGKSDEHTDQHVIAASDEMNVSDRYLRGPGSQKALNQELTHYYDLYRPEFTKGEVYHFSLSNHADDRTLSDAEWADVARGAVAELGFDVPGGKAPTRWVAIRHGLSKNGNDHVHVAVVLARADGTKAVEPRGDFAVLNRYSAEAERQFGLSSHRTPARAGAGSVPEASRADREISARLNEPVPLRIRLQREVRAAAAASGSEAEFVAALRSAGLHAQPRYATGGRTQVVGYKVAALRERDVDGTLIYFGGGRLAKDLSLPALRARWADTPADRARAVQLWGGARTGAPVGEVPSQRQAHDAAEQLLAGARGLAGSQDEGRWSQLAGQMSGVLAAASGQWEGPAAAELDQASRQLARASLIHAHPARRSQGPAPIAAHAVAGLLLARHRSLLSAAILMQVSLTVQALAGAADARFDADLARADLARVRDRAQRIGAAEPGTDRLAAATSASAASAGVDAGRNTMSSPSPEEEAGAALRPLALAALTAASMGVREAQRREAQEAEQTRSQERQLRDEQREQQRQDERAERAREQAARDQQRAADDRRRSFQVASRDPLWTASATREQMTRAVQTLQSGPAGNPLDQVAVQRIDEAGRKRFGDVWQLPEPDAGHDATLDPAPDLVPEPGAGPAAPGDGQTPAAGPVAGPAAPSGGVPQAAGGAPAVPGNASAAQQAGGAAANTQPGPGQASSAPASDPSRDPATGQPERPGADQEAGPAARQGYGASRVRGRGAGSPLVPPMMRSPEEADRGQEDERD